MRNDSKLENLLKDYTDALSRYVLFNDTYVSAKKDPSIVMDEEAEKRYTDEEGKQRYANIKIQLLEIDKKQEWKRAEKIKAKYLAEGGDPKNIEETFERVFGKKPKKASKPLTDREKFKNSLRIVRASHDRLLVTKDKDEIKKLNKLIEENSPILQKLRPALGLSVVSEVVKELEKEEKKKVTTKAPETPIPLERTTPDVLPGMIPVPEEEYEEEPPVETVEPVEETTEPQETVEPLEETTDPEETVEEDPAVISRVPAAPLAAAPTGATVTKKGAKGKVKKWIVRGLLLAGVVWLCTKIYGCSKDKIDVDKSKAFDDDNKEQTVMTTPTATPTPTPSATPTPTPTPVVTYDYSNDGTVPLITAWDTSYQEPVSMFDTTPTPVETGTPLITDTPAVSETPAVTQTPIVTETPAPSEEPEEIFEWTAADEATIKGVNNYIGTYSLTDNDILSAQRSGYRSVISDELDLANQGIDQYQNFNAAVTLGNAFMNGQQVDGITIDDLNANQKAAFASDLRNALGYANTDGMDIDAIDSQLSELEKSTADELANQKTLVKTYK